MWYACWLHWTPPTSKDHYWTLMHHETCVPCWLHWTPPTSIDHYWTLMHHKTLFKSFNNKNTTTEKNETKNTNTKRKKKIGNNILVWYSLLDTKMENYTEQYTNKKRETKELKLKCLRTVCHVGDAGHRPLRKITIEHWCITKRCSNHSITRIQQRKNKETKNKYQKKKRIGKNISGIQFVIIKWKHYKEQYTKKEKRIEIEWLRTASHVGYTGHRPLRNITIERWCFTKHCSNHSITRLQQQEKKETKNTNTKKEEENWK